MLCDQIFNGILIQAVPHGRHWLTVRLCLRWVAKWRRVNLQGEEVLRIVDDTRVGDLFGGVATLIATYPNAVYVTLSQQYLLVCIISRLTLSRAM